MDLAQKPVYKLDLAAGTSVVNLTTPLVEGDDRAQTFTLELTDKGAPANLNGYSVLAYFGRGKTVEAEADTIAVPGSVSGNVATITLTESCYTRSCYFSMPIRLTNGSTGQKRTYLIVRGTVLKSVDGTIIDPDGSVPSLDDLFAQITVMERTRQAAEEATEEALAAATRADEAREGIQGDLATLTEENDHVQVVASNNDYHYFEPIRLIEYVGDAQYGNVYSKNKYTFRAGTMLAVSALEGMRVCFRINSVNHFIGKRYVFAEEASNVEIRIYYTDTSINLNDYVKVYFPTYPFGTAQSGLVKGMYFADYYIAGENGAMYTAAHRRSTADMKLPAGAKIGIADGYKFKTNIWDGSKYAISGWAKSCVIAEDCIGHVIIARDDNADFTEDLSSIIMLDIPDAENADPYTAEHTLANALHHEEIVFTNDGNSAQGIANDADYIYCFSGNGAVVKIDKATKAAETLTIDGLGHANSAAYNPDDDVFYIVGGEQASIVTLDHDLKIIGEYSTANVYGISYCDGQLYCLYGDGSVKVQDTSFAELSTITLTPAIPSGMVYQGFETDGVYCYIPLYDPANNRHAVYVYDVWGKYHGKRYIEREGYEVEDITIDINTGDIYCSYQYGSNYAMAVSRLTNDTDWVHAGEYISSVSANTSINAKRPPMFRISGNYLYMRGVVRSADTGNILRLPSAIMPKEVVTRIARAFDASGNVTTCVLAIGTYGDGLQNTTYPINKKTDGELVVVLDGIKLLCKALID